MLSSLHKLFNKEPRINYVPEIRNGCDVWEQAFRRYCVDPLASSDAHKWGRTYATIWILQRLFTICINNDKTWKDKCQPVSLRKTAGKV